ncbi:MAG: signal peptide peptidase SppA [Candidatus Rariloculaceae bacterium]
MKLLRPIFALFRTLWRVLDGLRKGLSLIFLLFLMIIVLAALSPEVPTVPENAALVLAPQGALVEQLSGDPIDRAIAKARGIPQQEVLLQDLIEAIREARDDDRIEMLVLDLGGMNGSGLSKLQELANEIVLFKASEKQVIAFGDGFDRNQYYLAAHADEIYLNPMGFVYIDGYSRYMPYYRAAIENLSIDVNVWRVGEYKSFVEPITRDDMSDEHREAVEQYLGALWDAYQADVTAARELNEAALQEYADNAADLLMAAEGDSARLALDYGLVDELLARDEIKARLDTLMRGEENDDDDDDDYPRVSHDRYLSALRAVEVESEEENRVGVIVAAGAILDGSQPPGTIGGDSTAALIRRASEDDDLDALVLRVDSGGGSAFASEVVLRELEVFQESGRPLVVSMSSLAASGGYWISMSADEIWASPTTLTGSIGIGAVLPTFQRSLDRLGIHVDGTGTTDLSGQADPLRGLGPAFNSIISQSIQHGYDLFITKVANHRDQTVEAIDESARGRVWIATDAQERGLVDNLGNLDDAIASAAGLAGLEDDSYEIIYLEKRLELAERIALELASVSAPLVSALGLGSMFSTNLQAFVDVVAEPFKVLDRLNDPQNIYAICLCDAN